MSRSPIDPFFIDYFYRLFPVLANISKIRANENACQNNSAPEFNWHSVRCHVFKFGGKKYVFVVAISS